MGLQPRLPSGLRLLLAAFGGGQAVDPLVGLGAGELAQGLTDAAFEAGDAVLTPKLLSEGLEKVDLALARLLGRSSPASPGGLLSGFLGVFLRTFFHGLGL